MESAQFKMAATANDPKTQKNVDNSVTFKDIDLKIVVVLAESDAQKIFTTQTD